MTEDQKTQIDSQTENEACQNTQVQKNNTQYGTPLTVINTFILLCLVILALSYKKDIAAELNHSKDTHEIQKSWESHETLKNEDWATPHISQKTKIHILYGDETGGAHYHTVTTPCKSVFPKDWNPDKIIQITEKISANDNLQWRPRKNGKMYAQETHDGIVVRVIMDPQREYVITSYPLNAERNPCPKDKNNVPTTQYQGQGKDNKIFDNIKIKHNYNN